MIHRMSQSFGRNAANRLSEIHQPSEDGARALLESFYFAFNQRDIEVFQQVWAEDELIQLNNPLGGILRGYVSIAALYAEIFGSSARVWVEFSDIVEYQTDSMVVFAGRETGEFARDEQVVPLAIRTSRIIQWFGSTVGWRQVHHHGSIDNVEMLAQYQRAVRGE